MNRRPLLNETGEAVVSLLCIAVTLASLVIILAILR